MYVCSFCSQNFAEPKSISNTPQCRPTSLCTLVRPLISATIIPTMPPRKVAAREKNFLLEVMSWYHESGYLQSNNSGIKLHAMHGVGFYFIFLSFNSAVRQLQILNINNYIVNNQIYHNLIWCLLQIPNTKAIDVWGMILLLAICVNCLEFCNSVISQSGIKLTYSNLKKNKLNTLKRINLKTHFSSMCKLRLKR